MKKLLVFVFAPMLVLAQSDKEQIETVLRDQVEAWNKGDVEGYMKGYWNSDHTTFVSGARVLTGYDSVLVRYKRNYGTREKMGFLSFDDLKIRMVGKESAFVTGQWQLQRKEDKPGGRFTLLLEKKLAGWRIVYDHTSSVSE
ncbi:MAG: nuclear transport factor 2 family protein [Bacteroidota bacterium]